VRTSKQRIPIWGQIVIAVVGALAVGAAAYLVLVTPRKAEATRLQRELDAADQRIADYRAKSLAAKGRPQIRSADIFRLAKAMPDQTDMSGVLLQLSQTAADTGITFQSIAPQTPAPVSGYQAIPIQLGFEGNFYDLVDFLFRLRNLVGVHGGALDASGRLFAVDTLDFSEGHDGFPQITATLVVDAFVYGTAAPAAAGSAATPTDTTASTTSTTSTTTAVPPSGGSAAVPTGP
jgi:Pilus assembly protein, PilO